MMAYVFVDAALAPESGWLAWLIALSVKGALVLSVAGMIALLLRKSGTSSLKVRNGIAGGPESVGVDAPCGTETPALTAIATFA